MWRPAIRTISKRLAAAAVMLLVLTADVWAMQYPVLMVWNCGSGNTTQYASPFLGEMESMSTATRSEVPMPVGGTFSNLRVRARTAHTGAQTRTFAILVNGTPGSLTVTIDSSNQVATDSTNSVSVSSGDLVELRATGSGTPPADTYEVVYEFSASSGSNVSVYAHGAGDVITTGDDTDAFYSEGDWASVGSTHGVVATPGTITKMTSKLSAAPGGGNTRVLTIYKNGVAQDGSGGTPDTRISFGAADTNLSSTFSLSVVAGDVVYIVTSSTGTPTSAREAGTIQFSASTTNHWNVGYWSGFGPPNSAATRYQTIVGGSNTSGGWDTTEANTTINNGPTSFWLSRMRVVQTSACGSGDTCTYTLRKNGADQSLSVQIAGAVDVSGSDLADRVQITDGDDINTIWVGTGTPSSQTNTTVVFAGSLADPGSGVGGGGGFNALLIVGLVVAAAVSQRRRRR
jgi:hypothetical protein